MFYWILLFQIGFFITRDYVFMICICTIVILSILLSKKKLEKLWKKNQISFQMECIKIIFAFLLSMLLFYSYFPKDLIFYVTGDELHGYCTYIDQSGFDFYSYYNGSYKKFRVFKKDMDESYENTYLCISGFGKKTLLPANRGGFDHDSYLKAHHYDGYFYPKIIEKSDKIPIKDDLWVSFKLCMSKIRKNLMDRLYFLQEDSKILLSALLFGEISNSWLSEYSRQLGIIHIFVISGLHFNLIAGGFKKICHLFFKNYHMEQFLYILFCFLFLNLNSFAIGSMRAFLMSMISVVCFYIKKKYDINRTLILICGIWCFVSPNVLNQSGFILSFAGTLCVVQVSKHSIIKSITSKFLQSFITGAVVSIMMLPVIYVNYLEIHLIQIFILPLITPIIVVYLIIGIVFLSINFLFGLFTSIPILAHIHLHCVDTLDFLADILKKFMEENLFVEYLKVDIPYVLSIFLTICILLYLLLQDYRNDIIHRVELFLLCVVVALYCSISNLDIGFSVRTFALKDGEAYLVRWNDANLVYDVGNDKEIVNCLKRCGVSTIDLLVISHFDKDHCGKLDSVLKNFEVKSTLYTASTVQNLNLKGAKIKYGAECSEEKNESSIVMFIEYQGKSLLLNGDIEEKGLKFQNREFAQELKKADIVKIPHHGSYREGFDEMFQLSSPKCYVIGGGRGKRIKKEKTLKKLSSSNLSYYDTNDSGEILITFRFGNWKFVEYKNEL